MSLPRSTQLEGGQECDKIEDLFQRLAKPIDEYDKSKLNILFALVTNYSRTLVTIN